MSCKGLPQMRQLSGYLSINECCLCLPKCTPAPPTVRALVSQRQSGVIKLANHLDSNELGDLMFNFSDLFRSVMLSILLGPIRTDQARLFSPLYILLWCLFPQLDVLIPFGEEL